MVDTQTAKDKTGNPSYRDMLSGNNDHKDTHWDDWSEGDNEDSMKFNESISGDEGLEETSLTRIVFSKEEKAMMQRP
ncbi:hypothetical protein REPUB_Repub02eG0098100 [Reevesia pubescens]